MIKADNWIIYKREDYDKVKDIVNYDTVVCLISNNEVYEAYYNGSNKLNTMQVMRIVIAPYRDKGGQPRGWFPGKDGTPLVPYSSIFQGREQFPSYAVVFFKDRFLSL